MSSLRRCPRPLNAGTRRAQVTSTLPCNDPQPTSSAHPRPLDLNNAIAPDLLLGLEEHLRISYQTRPSRGIPATTPTSGFTRSTSNFPTLRLSRHNTRDVRLSSGLQVNLLACERRCHYEIHTQHPPLPNSPRRPDRGYQPILDPSDRRER